MNFPNGCCTSARPRDPAKILAVDDSPSMRGMLAYLLRNSGHRVMEAEDGTAALAAAVRHDFDLVLTDQDMPHMDGLSLVRSLRRLPAYGDTPILMLTTERGAEIRRRSQAAGASAWLAKPFDPDKLLAMLNAILDINTPR